jgi:hypothetical protein
MRGVGTVCLPTCETPSKFNVDGRRGGLALFGDQSLFCRATDFHRAGGYDASLPIMEDVQLCIRLTTLMSSAQQVGVTPHICAFHVLKR